MDFALLLVQVSVILAVGRATGALLRRIGQPQVIGEMVAGIILGPSLLGWVAPAISASLFPQVSLGYLSVLSQLGLILFMFLVGLELDPTLLRGRGTTAVLVSHVSIVFPMFLGAGVALVLYPRLSDGHVSFLSFALFMGTAMSLTAFPVLARILSERKLTTTRIGSIAIACAAVGDLTAWCILAAVVVLVNVTGATDGRPVWLTVGGSLTYVVLMIGLVRPALSRLRPKQGQLTAVLILTLASAWVTEWLGIHAMFGAFLAGAVLPRHEQFVADVRGKLEDVTVVLLVPLYFAFTGLRTSIGLVTGLEMWSLCALIVAVAIAGKFGGAFVAARASGQSWRDASAIGILMNTRGLVELVVLNVGLDIGVLSPVLFAMMVIMALVTTFMTSPLLNLVHLRKEPLPSHPTPRPWPVRPCEPG